MKKYLLPEGGRFYKANLHLHTTVSDGRLTPEEIKKEYMERGYSILAYSDHEVIVPHNDLSDERFLALTGYEISIFESLPGKCDIRVYHLNLLSKDPENDISPVFPLVDIDQNRALATKEMMQYNYPRKYSQECVNDIIENAHREGFLVSLNHTVWSTQNYADYAELKGLWGAEVYKSASNIGGARESELYLEDGVLQVETSEVSGIYVTTERIKRWSATAAEGETLTGKSFDLNDYITRSAPGKTAKRPYFRVTVIDEKGRSAWSRAYFLDELQ